MMSHDFLKNFWKLVMVMFSCCFQGMETKQKAQANIEHVQDVQAKKVS